MSVEATHAAVPTARRRDPMPASLLGVILFVASECVFFAALFGAYFTIRSNAGSDWPPAGISEGLHAWPLPAIATTFLVLSSVTMQFAIWAIRRGDRATMLRFLKITLVLGCVFLGMQAYDYATLGFSIHDTVFGTTFFTMTGFHGAHVAGGVVFIYLMLARGWSGQITREDHTGLEAAAIYWHFVDIVWIGLFCTLYLLK
ncbi:MAG TPA: heme-copper oxidase subunit III [Actinomycetota bacterium]|jgi:cytochrome c oxidase subunit 3